MHGWSDGGGDGSGADYFTDHFGMLPESSKIEVLYRYTENS
jgi:hypothetical protein